MTPQPPEQEWIISDKDYYIALEYFHLVARPLEAELKKERERVLNEASRIIQNEWMCSLPFIIYTLESLRSEP